MKSYELYRMATFPMTLMDPLKSNVSKT